MRMTRTLTTAAVTVALAACGGGGGGGGGSTTIAPPPVDTTPPTLSTTTPADGAGPVSIVVNPSATFSEPLDAASVTDTTVQLTSETGIRVRGTVVLNANGTEVNFESDEPLDQGTEYTLHIDAVRDVANNAAAPVSVSFRTFISPLTRRVDFFDGVAVAQIDYENEANGRLFRLIRRADAGLDGLWQTDDETPRNYTEYSRDAVGRTIETRFFDNPGVDGTWFNADDVISSRRTVVFGADGSTERSIDWLSGDDGLFNTDDDVPRRYTDITYNAFGDVLTRASFGGPGPDDLWLTDDDEFQNAVDVFEYDETGFFVQLTSADPGPDRAVGTDDDIVESNDAARRNDDLMRIERIQYNDAGDDGVWFTDDDLIRSYSLEPFDGEGRPTGLIRGQGPGLDGIWLTNDDEIRSPFTRTVYNDTDPAQTILTTFSYSDVGPDGEPLTGDDELASIRIETVAAKDLSLMIESYSSPGDDGVWQTADDLLSALQVTERDADLNILRVRSFRNAGPDGVPLTPDDEPGSESSYGPAQ
ncbi:MAG: Ig-like domain-containing protein [Pseudomonadota bacterium]